MTIFDFNNVKDFAGDINSQLDQCENGEGTQCYGMDTALGFFAERCCAFAEKLRQWARDVFAGRIAFDQAVDELWKAELTNLIQRAQILLAKGRQAEQDCFVLDGKGKLESSLWKLNQLRSGGWVTASLSVGPSARHKLAFNSTDQNRVESLEPLPADWIPYDHRQAAQLQRLKNK